MYGLQHGAFAHTEQQAIKGPKIKIIHFFYECLFVLAFPK